MLYSIKSRDVLEKLEELVLLNNQVKAVRLPVELGKQNSHEKLKKVFESVTDTLKLPLKIKKNLDINFQREQQSFRDFKQQTFRNIEW